VGKYMHPPPPPPPTLPELGAYSQREKWKEKKPRIAIITI